MSFFEGIHYGPSYEKVTCPRCGQEVYENCIYRHNGPIRCEKCETPIERDMAMGEIECDCCGFPVDKPHQHGTQVFCSECHEKETRIQKIDPDWHEAEQFDGSFVNISSHSVKEWTSGQKEAAESLGTIVELPAELQRQFSQVTPETNIPKLAEEITEFCQYENAKVAMVQGEMRLTFSIIKRLQTAGVKCLAATTVRETVEVKKADGSIEKKSVFKFTGFGEYES